jgi:hypothetical protein
MDSRLQTRSGVVLGGCVTALVTACLTILLLNLLTPPRDSAAIGQPRVPTQAILPTLTPTVLPPTPPLVLADNFSTQKNWPRVVGAATFGYTDNGYLLSPTVNDGFARVLLANYQNRASQDLTMELEAAPAQKSNDVEYGVLFWHSQDSQSRERFLYFGVNTQGEFRLRAYEPVTTTNQTAQNFRWVDLVPASTSLEIQTGSQPNRLRVDVHPHRLLAFVNGQLVLDRNNADIDEYRERTDFDGRVGMIAVSLGKPNAGVVFTNFKLFVNATHPTPRPPSNAP